MTPDERKAALVEKVARSMSIADGFDPDAITDNHTPTCPGPAWRLWVNDARAALTVALEDAARVLAAGNEGHDWSPEGAAAAIRALIPGSSK